MMKYYNGPVWLHCRISYAVDASRYLGMWLDLTTSHGKHGSSAPRKGITQPTSWPYVASPTWSSTEQVARPITKRLHPSNWRPLEAYCRPRTWWCNDATALASYATMMMMRLGLLMVNLCTKLEVSNGEVNSELLVESLRFSPTPFGAPVGCDSGRISSRCLASINYNPWVIAWRYWRDARLAVLVEHQLVSDTDRHRQTDTEPQVYLWCSGKYTATGPKLEKNQLFSSPKSTYSLHCVKIHSQYFELFSYKQTNSVENSAWRIETVLRSLRR